MADTSEYDVIREGEEIILRIDASNWPYVPSLEDSEIAMAKTIDYIMEIGAITKIVLYQKRDYEYDFAQAQLLMEIARAYKDIYDQKDIVGYDTLVSDSNFTRCVPAAHAEVQRFISRMLKADPLGCYVEVKRAERRQRIRLSSDTEARCKTYIEKYLKVLDFIAATLEKTRLVTISQPYLPGYKVGDRAVYRKIFRPVIKPDFMFTKLMSEYPTDGEELDSYTVGENTEITIFRLPDSVQYLYHMMPPEFKLSEEKYDILDLARKIMTEHKPERSEFVDPQRMRTVFFNVGRDLIQELCDYRKVKMRAKEVEELAQILLRYTVGFGLIEVLLSDEKIQDISINSPMGQIPIFVVHQDFDDCTTNIVPTKPEAESWASKLRMISGRPLDEANPILDTELELPGASTRVSTITEPLNPTGLAFSFRRHRDKPWTLPLFCKVGMITPLAAGLLSFLIDGTRTMLVAGTRSSGKTSLIGALLIEIMRRYRIITVEDTLELPTTSLRRLGYNVQPMKVASALAKGSTEMTAADGIRATLRLGDSALIVGEVRSGEAKALYEAMRVGAAANVVAGTIHGDSPYGVFDRVVNDIGVPKTSFKATDIIVVANPIRSPDGIHRWRRVTSITEVRKSWNDDPLTENGFVELMKYEPKTDQLLPSDDLINGDSDILKAIAGNIKEFAGNWNAVWDNIQLRAQCKEAQVKIAEQLKDNDLLEAQFTIRCNDEFHKICEAVTEEVGSLDSKIIYDRWDAWLKREVKKKAVK